VGYKFPNGTPVNFSTPLAAVERPSETIAVACATWYGAKKDVLDTAEGWDALYPPGWKEVVQPWGCLSGRHGGGSNCVFVDGHVKWLRREQAYTPEMFGL
jgi:prepilin-type processing-associated H-X9-DG protein